MTMTVTGSCLCGAVAFRASLPERHFDVCHCGTCRKWGGGPAFACNAAGLEIADGAPVTWFASSDHAERGFCATCGAHLFWRLKDGGHVSLYAGALDDAGELAFTTEIFVDEQPSTYRFANDTTRMTGAEVLAALAGDAD